MIEGEHLEDSVAFSEDDDGCVRQADLEISKAREDPGSGRHIVRAERLQPVGASDNFGQQRLLGPTTDPRGEQIVELG